MKYVILPKTTNNEIPNLKSPIGITGRIHGRREEGAPPPNTKKTFLLEKCVDAPP